MQELRIVLIVLGVLAIAGLLIHGLWTNRREQSSKFSDKPLGKIKEETNARPQAKSGEPDNAANTDGFDVVRVTKKAEKKEPSFAGVDEDVVDPLMSTGFNEPAPAEESQAATLPPEELPSITISSDAYTNRADDEEIPTILVNDTDSVLEPVPEPILYDEPQVNNHPGAAQPTAAQPSAVSAQAESEATADQGGSADLEVIVLHVKAAANTQFVGTDLFTSMMDNGLHFGAMDIYHRHADLSGNGKVLFSVANMMKPGTLVHNDPETYTTDGISFFMTLPCYGDPEQNFKLMLHTAQMIAEDLKGQVLDEQRNLMTDAKIDVIKQQIHQFTKHHDKQKQESAVV